MTEIIGSSTLTYPFPINRVGFPGSLGNIARTICVYNQKRVFKGLTTPQDFLDKVLELLPETGSPVIKKASCLWLMERLAREGRKFDNAAFLLKEKNLEPYKPILHVGWGMACLAETGFDYPRFSQAIKEAADPRYRLLALEPIGVIYVACRHPLRSSLIGIKIPAIPHKKTFSDFIGSFGKEELDVISHGYGRGIYFRSLSLGSALKRTLRCPPCFNPHTALRGLAFAYTMVNCTDLDKVLLTESRLLSYNQKSEEMDDFRKGIVSALSFLEWNFSGVLSSLEKSPHVEQAEVAVASYRKAGGIYSL